MSRGFHTLVFLCGSSVSAATPAADLPGLLAGLEARVFFFDVDRGEFTVPMSRVVNTVSGAPAVYRFTVDPWDDALPNADPDDAVPVPNLGSTEPGGNDVPAGTPARTVLPARPAGRHAM